MRHLYVIVLTSTLGFSASTGAIGQSQIQPIYSGDPQGCDVLGESGEASPDHIYFDPRSGLSTYAFHCDFLQVLPHPELPWHVATAFCEEPGYQYPDLILFAEQPDGSMTVISQSGLLQSQIDAKASPIADGDYVLCDAE